MNAADLVGYIAGFCTTVSFLPQVIQVWKTRSVADISLGMYSLFVSGIVLWLAFGIAIGSWPVIVPNLITLLLAGSVLVMKLRFGIRQAA
ncbi:SemiSWEET transporter [Chitinolyticbacter meiyuanensis]|uniref:SemiSWEET transporter n=1 Tax=Chitinolyticbacter meiyuanensis TaxID=682798 RepID=UPI0011E5D1CC|nr:SemiSWEET transporter [Chitinolyticbacter meiyuanensis]